MNDVLNEYEDHADALSDVFLTLDSAAIFAPVAEYFPAPPGRVLDLAAGPGRDARYMADLGFDVTAVEPIETFRIRGAEVVPEARWIDDRLPELPVGAGLGERFDLILMCAVLHHLDPPDRAASIASLGPLLAPGGRAILSRKHMDAGDRAADRAELLEHIAAAGLRLIADPIAPSVRPENIAMGADWTWAVVEAEAGP